jgi:hypothetical protein
MIPFIIGLAGILAYIAAYRYTRWRNVYSFFIAIACAVSLLLYAWEYNPRIPRSLAHAPNSFATTLQTYSATHQTPARLFSHERLLQDRPRDEDVRRTDPISPAFTVIQPVQTLSAGFRCLSYQTQALDNRHGELLFSIQPTLFNSPIRSVTAPVTTLLSSQGNEICFEPIPDSANKTYYIKVSSVENSGIQLAYKNTQASPLNAYFIRALALTPQNIEASQKRTQLVMEPVYETTIDREAAMLARHIQVTADTSSARWIGALSIRPYREFIEKFFANDGEVMDGDGKHVIERNRLILDLSGVTHLIQILPAGTQDTMTQAGFVFEQGYHTGQKEVRLYTNPTAWPKTFVVPNAEFRAAADETRFAMLQPDFDPHQIVLLSGEAPPGHLPPVTSEPLQATSTIKTYTPTRIDLEVTTAREAFVVITDSTTEQWQTYVDNELTPHLIAYSVFKVAQVPAGTHTVSFVYKSPAAEKAKKIAMGSLVVWLLIALAPLAAKLKKSP